MKRLALATLAAALLGVLAPAPAGAAFGLKDLDATFSKDEGATALFQAGAHPFSFDVDLAANTKKEEALPEIDEVPDGEVKDLVVTQIAGLAGNPTAVPRCRTVEFLQFGGDTVPDCPLSSVLGIVTATVGGPNETFEQPVFNLEPPPGSVAKFGFAVVGVPVTIEATVKPTPPYNIVATTANVTNTVNFYAAHLALWGVPAAHSHDVARGGEARVPQTPFLTTPRACEGPLETLFAASSWQGGSFAEGILTHNDAEPPEPFGFTGCEKLGFSPDAAAVPSTDQASSPSGLDVSVDVKDEELQNGEGIADSDIKKATVVLPEGLTANPSLAEGLATCSEADFADESVDSKPGRGCPQASKIGAVEVETPLLEGHLLKGSLFIATQDQNPFHSLLALYMVIKDKELGILVKLAGKISPDPHTGQLETTFGEAGQELPQFPLSHVRVHLREGGRSPLITPPGCGTYTTEAIFTPWANPSHPRTVPSSFQISKGPGGGPCPPPGPPPFAPGFEAGSLDNQAGAYAPFYLRLTRRDGDQA